LGVSRGAPRHSPSSGASRPGLWLARPRGSSPRRQRGGSQAATPLGVAEEGATLRGPTVSRIPRPVRITAVFAPLPPPDVQAPDASPRMSLRRGGRMDVAGGGDTTLLDTAERVMDARAAAHEVALRALRALGEAGRSS